MLSVLESLDLPLSGVGVPEAASVHAIGQVKGNPRLGLPGPAWSRSLGLYGK